MCLQSIIRNSLWSSKKAKTSREYALSFRFEVVVVTPYTSLLLSLLPHEILIRWFNYHMEEAGEPPCTNLTTDLKDCDRVTLPFPPPPPSFFLSS